MESKDPQTEEVLSEEQAKPEPQPQTVEPKVEEPISKPEKPVEEAPLTEWQKLLLKEMISQGKDEDMSLKAIQQYQLKQKEIVFGFYKDL